jgi:hypothetical protein
MLYHNPLHELVREPLAQLRSAAVGKAGAEP